MQLNLVGFMARRFRVPAVHPHPSRVPPVVGQNQYQMTNELKRIVNYSKQNSYTHWFKPYTMSTIVSVYSEFCFRCNHSFNEIVQFRIHQDRSIKRKKMQLYRVSLNLGKIFTNTSERINFSQLLCIVLF